MNIRTLLFCSLLFSSQVRGSVYQYPQDKRPAVSLKEACAISETILAKLGLGKDYYIFNVVIHGDESQSGAGAWTLMYRNTQGDQVQIGIYLTEDFCVVMTIPKSGKSTENGYTRDGNISPKWLEWQKRLRDQEANDPFGPPIKNTK
jgi:hypothetical protein